MQYLTHSTPVQTRYVRWYCWIAFLGHHFMIRWVLVFLVESEHAYVNSTVTLTVWVVFVVMSGRVDVSEHGSAKYAKWGRGRKQIYSGSRATVVPTSSRYVQAIRNPGVIQCISHKASFIWTGIDILTAQQCCSLCKSFCCTSRRAWKSTCFQQQKSQQKWSFAVACFPSRWPMILLYLPDWSAKASSI